MSSACLNGFKIIRMNFDIFHRYMKGIKAPWQNAVHGFSSFSAYFALF